MRISTYRNIGIVKGKALNPFALGCGGNPHLPPQATQLTPDSAPVLKAKCVVFTHFAGERPHGRQRAAAFTSCAWRYAKLSRSTHTRDNN